jgi:hypothetical protein
MTAIPNYVVHCEGPACRKVHTPVFRCVTTTEARASAAGSGWTRTVRRDRGGSSGKQIDLCPDCARRVTES